MYLTCPNCETVYTVRAAMLREGQGEVRCGACHTLFNALDYLSDELPDGSSAEAPVTAPGGPGATAHDQAAVDSVSGEDVQADAGELPVGLAPIRVQADDPVPDALSQDWRALQHDPRAGSRNLGLMSLAVGLLLALAVQYMWFAPRDLVARFPQSATVVERFCDLAGCLAPERRDPGRIQILSREVRAHPRYEGALLVSATFSNVAPWPQPFPRLRFQLYNVNGQTIASRVFSPADYLAGAMPPDSLLPPGQPLQVALEMLAPEEASVSFEFSFF